MLPLEILLEVYGLLHCKMPSRSGADSNLGDLISIDVSKVLEKLKVYRDEVSMQQFIDKIIYGTTATYANVVRRGLRYPHGRSNCHAELLSLFEELLKSDAQVYFKVGSCTTFVENIEPDPAKRMLEFVQIGLLAQFMLCVIVDTIAEGLVATTMLACGLRRQEVYRPYISVNAPHILVFFR